MTARTGSLGAALEQSSLRGGALGAGLSTAFQIGQMVSNQQYSASDYLIAGERTFIAGGASGVTGAAIETTLSSQLSQSLLQSAAEGTEVSALAPLLGKVAAGGVAGGPAAAVFQVGSMLLSDQQYSGMDYAAEGTRAGVVGALSGALAAGAGAAVEGALVGSVAPGAGNLIGLGAGFVVGVGVIGSGG